MEQKDLNEIIEKAAQSLNMDSEKLKGAMQNRNLNELISNLNGNQLKMVQDVLNDPVKSKKVLATKQAQEVLKKFMK